MTVIKHCDFEAGLTTGAGAFTSVTAVPVINSTSLLKGVDCVDCTYVNATCLGTNSGLNINDLYVSMYFRITQLPGSPMRILNSSNGTTQGNIVINSSGTLNIRNSSTVVGSASAALSVDTTYRIGFRYKCSTALGNADAIIEGYLATGDAEFGAPFASSSTELMVTSNANFTSQTAGNTNSTTASGTIFIDDIFIDDAALPGPSLAPTLFAYVGSFNTGTGAVSSTVAVTGLAFQPKLVLMWWNGRIDTVDAVGRRTHQRGFGAAISTTDRRNTTSLSQDTPTSMVTNHAQDDTECIFLTTTADAIDGKMDLQSMDAGGFTLVVDDVFVASYRVQYLALGGTDLTDVIGGSFTKQAGTGNQDIATVGFEPSLVLLFSSKQTTMAGTIAVDSDFMLGAAVSASQQAVFTGGSNDAANTSIAKSYCKAGECVAFMDAAFGSTTDRGTFVGMLSNGFQINWTENAGAAQIISYVAIKGPGVAIGDLLTQTNTTTDIVESGFGFPPRAAMFVSHGKVQSTSDTIQADDALSIGAFAGMNAQAAMASFDDDAAATAVVGSAVENDSLYIHMPNTAATVDGLMVIKTISPTSFTTIMTDADVAQSFVWYVTIGDTPIAVPAPPEIYHVIYRN